jgi:hypothetical protein
MDHNDGIKKGELEKRPAVTIDNNVAWKRHLTDCKRIGVNQMAVAAGPSRDYQ